MNQTNADQFADQSANPRIDPSVARRAATLSLNRIAVAIVLALCASARAEITFFESESYAGRTFTAQYSVDNFREYGFNDRSSSVVVLGERWEVCADVRFQGRCVVLRPGRYPSLDTMGLGDRISSARALEWQARVQETEYAPPADAAYDNRRRNQEALFDAPVSSTRAVMRGPEQRCWVEKRDVQVQNNPNAGVGGAIAGALVGGVLGHQIGGGVGKELATAGGAVGGAVLGANLGRGYGGSSTKTQDIQHCNSTPGPAQPEYWDVSYSFRGRNHQVQMVQAPGATVTVNAAGEPRTR
jgi:uncharacterized protein YcfJ